MTDPFSAGLGYCQRCHKEPANSPNSLCDPCREIIGYQREAKRLRDLIDVNASHDDHCDADRVNGRCSCWVGQALDT